jgi:hypothetical protein
VRESYATELIGKTLMLNANHRRIVKRVEAGVLLKTGAKRQSEPVSLLLASPAYFLARKQQSQ